MCKIISTPVVKWLHLYPLFCVKIKAEERDTVSETGVGVGGWLTKPKRERLKNQKWLKLFLLVPFFKDEMMKLTALALAACIAGCVSKNTG